MFDAVKLTFIYISNVYGVKTVQITKYSQDRRTNIKLFVKTLNTSDVYYDRSKDCQVLYHNYGKP